MCRADLCSRAAPGQLERLLALPSVSANTIVGSPPEFGSEGLAGTREFGLLWSSQVGPPLRTAALAFLWSCELRFCHLVVPPELVTHCLAPAVRVWSFYSPCLRPCSGCCWCFLRPTTAAITNAFLKFHLCRRRSWIVRPCGWCGINADFLGYYTFDEPREHTDGLGCTEDLVTRTFCSGNTALHNVHVSVGAAQMQRGLYSKCMWTTSAEPRLGPNDDIDDVWLWSPFPLCLLS